MLTTTKTKKKAGGPITSVRLSLNQVGGCFGGMCRLPPLTNYLFDEMFRLDEIRSGVHNRPRAVSSPVAPAVKDQAGEEE